MTSRVKVVITLNIGLTRERIWCSLFFVKGTNPIHIFVSAVTSLNGKMEKSALDIVISPILE
jgi:hypothetical protein